MKYFSFFPLWEGWHIRGQAEGRAQFKKINMPNSTLLQNQEVAEEICEELNKGVKPDTVREFMSVLKEAMCKKLSKG